MLEHSHLEKFFYNLLTNSKYELKNRFVHISSNDVENKTNINKNSLTMEEQAIINIIKSNPFATQEEIASKISKSVRTVKNYMLDMQHKNLIERKNGKRSFLFMPPKIKYPKNTKMKFPFIAKPSKLFSKNTLLN